LFNSGGTEAWERWVNPVLSGNQRSGRAASMVLQTQLFAADRYKEKLDENKLFPLSPTSLSNTESLPTFF